MTDTAQACMLPDGRRLHLHHGPIDLIVEVFGPARDVFYDRAIRRFDTLLTDLAVELSALRAPCASGDRFVDPVARRMQAAVTAHCGTFVTPMAAVAGSVADEILAAMAPLDRVEKAYVNNGGDIAFHLSPGAIMRCAGPSGPITFRHDEPVRGVATSGWRGRSHSLGIADAVTVAAATAAQADVAATLIANAVDLPEHPAIQRVPACEIAPDSDLDARLVTTAVGALSPSDTQRALQRGMSVARHMQRQGLIAQAALCLQDQTIALAPHDHRNLTHA